MQFISFKRRNDYVDDGGPVRHLDDSGLRRPLGPSAPQRIVMGAFVAAAAVIGAYLLYSVLTGMQAGGNVQASMEENLAREVPYNLPSLAGIATLPDNAAIKQQFVDAGETVYDYTSEEEAAVGKMRLIRLPPDVTELDAAAMLAGGGIGSLDAAKASLLLNGAWMLDVDRSEGTSLRVAYADFTAGSVEAAVQNAIASEGFDPLTPPEGGAGVDEVGNTYQTGTVDAGGTVGTWQVSAIALSSMYDIAGFPDDAVYVGVRLTL